MPLKKSAWLVAAACISLTAASGSARAEDKPSIEPRAERILKAAVENLVAHKSFMFRGAVTTESALRVGQRIEYNGTVQAAVRRPDRVWVKNDGETARGSNWYDGKSLTHLDLDNNAYASWQAPSNNDELFEKMKEKLGFVLPLSPLMRSDLDKEIFKKIQTGFYVGETVVNGNTCSHLAFSQENIDWQLWVDTVVPVIRRVAITYKKQPGAPQYAVTFTSWDFNVMLPDSVFTFEPPPGAMRAEFEIVKQ